LWSILWSHFPNWRASAKPAKQARSAQRSQCSSLLCNRGSGRISLGYVAQCALAVHESRFVLLVPYPIFRNGGWAGRLLMCLVGRPTDNIRPLRSSDDHRYSGRPLAHVLHCLNSQDGMMCEFGSINSASKRQPSSKFGHHVSQSACPREWYVAATTSALGAVRCVVIHRLQAS